MGTRGKGTDCDVALWDGFDSLGEGSAVSG